MKFYIVQSQSQSGLKSYKMEIALEPARELMKTLNAAGAKSAKMLVLEVNDEVLLDLPDGGTAHPGFESVETVSPVDAMAPKPQPKDDKNTKAFYGYPLHDIIENLLLPHYNKPNLPVGVLALALFGSKYSDKVLQNIDSVSHTATMLHRLIVAFSKATTTIGSVTIPNSGTIEVHLQPDDIDYGMSPAMNQIAGMKVVNKVVVTQQMMNTINGISDEEFNLPFGVKLADLLPLDAAGSQDHIWDYIKGNTQLFELFPAVKNESVKSALKNVTPGLKNLSEAHKHLSESLHHSWVGSGPLSGEAPKDTPKQLGELILEGMESLDDLDDGYPSKKPPGPILLHKGNTDPGKGTVEDTPEYKKVKDLSKYGKGYES